MPNDVIDVDSGLFLDAAPDFFAPAPTDALDHLIAQYRDLRKKIEVVAAFQQGPEAQAVLGYFLEGNSTRERSAFAMSNAREQLFREDGAVKALDASFWSKALSLTDVLDMMPQARRSEWNKQIEEQTCPTFEPEAVRATLQDLILRRATFFGERVDGIFRGLSGEHVTNAPEGFGKRMIIASVLTYYGTVDFDRAGLINDLRCVIAKFMGRDEPPHWTTRPVLESLKARWGEWVSVDAGALRIRLYKKGTAHLEVHPDIAWRLNRVLASLHPNAIPAQFRTRPTRRSKDFPTLLRPLPFAVLEILAAYKQAYEFKDPEFREGRVEVPNTIHPERSMREQPRELVREAHCILEALGGVPEQHDRWRFPYPPLAVLKEVIVSGCLPETTSHQYYATPEPLARECVELAEVGDDDQVLEPSAGQGGIAQFLPRDRTTCVEISALHVAVLKARGFQAIEADFLQWAERCTTRWAAIVMNPPFSDGRALAHLRAAATLLAPGGRLVAILPATFKGRLDLLPGFEHRWSHVYEDAFAGTSARVAILVAIHAVDLRC